MQREIADELPNLSLQILAINGIDHESGIELMADRGHLPLLQDHPDMEAWEKWDVAYRDVVILNGQNEPVGAYNLTAHDLDDRSSYGTLKQMLVDAGQ